MLFTTQTISQTHKHAPKSPAACVSTCSTRVCIARRAQVPCRANPKPTTQPQQRARSTSGSVPLRPTDNARSLASTLRSPSPLPLFLQPPPLFSSASRPVSSPIPQLGRFRLPLQTPRSLVWSHFTCKRAERRFAAIAQCLISPRSHSSRRFYNHERRNLKSELVHTSCTTFIYTFSENYHKMIQL